MAHKKGGGSSRNGRDSNSQRLGVKRFDSEHVCSGTIIVRQRGTQFHAGPGTKIAKDDTLFAVSSGFVSFENLHGRRQQIAIRPIPKGAAIVTEIPSINRKTKSSVITDAGNNLLMGIQRFQKKYYSVYWPTKITVDDFTDIINTEILSFDSLPVSPGKRIVSVDEETATDHTEISATHVAMEGIIVITESEYQEYPLQRPLRIATSNIRQVRVNTLIGDFGYEVGLDNNNQIAVLSGLNLTDLIMRIYEKSHAVISTEYMTEQLFGHLFLFPRAELQINDDRKRI